MNEKNERSILAGIMAALIWTGTISVPVLDIMAGHDNLGTWGALISLVILGPIILILLWAALREK